MSFESLEKSDKEILSSERIKALKEKYGADLAEDPNRLFLKCKTEDGKEITHVLMKWPDIPLKSDKNKPAKNIPIEEAIEAYKNYPDRTLAEASKLLRERKAANKENSVKEK